MNPQEQFCPNPYCLARGKMGAGNIGVHSKKERRYICKRCGKTFSETKGTAFYYLKKGTNCSASPKRYHLVRWRKEK